jgi:hypothetical protein
MSKTGRAHGTLEPVIYFENSSGYVILAPQQIGEGTALARKIYEEKYRPQGWEWREAGANGLHEVDQLQRRLIDQEVSRDRGMAEHVGLKRDAVRKAVGETLRQRMTSSGTSEYEREFIRLYLRVRDDSKRDKYKELLKQRNYYLWAREQDSGTKVEDRMPSQPGEFWRAP